ncbi:hypothetical protein M4578_09165 [Salipiger sp. P9]|uniref:hypothetical protein n=1 Tax=Salipiger pentaromativorans TaxID=2943193 RepID=UPI002157C3A1|nr:hypothetical protein [Salipiger pentaromativorans]MCR8547996.1 hypothetical protein [Salipiger pentaromativorans]
MAKTLHGQTQDDGMGPLDSGLSVLFLAAFPMILLLFQGSPTSAFAGVLQLALFLAALRLIHRGQQLQNAYDAAETARAPRFPRKATGAALIGLMVLLLAGHHFVSLLLPLGFGLIASALTVMAFGLDPMKDKGQPLDIAAPQKTDGHAAPEAVLARIDSTLDDMVQEISDLGDAELCRQVEALKSSVMGLIRALCEQPCDMKRLRKPVVKFIDLMRRENASLLAAWDSGDRQQARRRYVAHITTLGEAFEENARKTGAKTGRDAFELEADLLWIRMRQDRAA